MYSSHNIDYLAVQTLLGANWLDLILNKKQSSLRRILQELRLEWEIFEGTHLYWLSPLNRFKADYS